MNKVYDFTESQHIIREAWDKAIDHLQTQLGDQFTHCVTDDAMPVFFDKVEQDIEYLRECPACGEVDKEGNFTKVEWCDNEVCYSCYERGCL